MQIDMDQLDNNGVLDLLDKLEAEAEKRELTFRRRYYQDAYHEEQLRKSVAKHKAEEFLKAVQQWGLLEKKKTDDELAVELLNEWHEYTQFATKDDFNFAKQIALELYDVLITLDIKEPESEFAEAMQQCEEWKKET